ncbi:MAG: hypothetical protein GY756_05120 [bacterium]|nr:hypothetical protein [bacterium]
MFNTINLYNQLLDEIKIKRPVYTRLIKEFSDMSLEEYTSTFKKYSNDKTNTCQSKSDFINISYQYVEKIYGIEIAEKFKNRLKKLNYIFTANHNGANLDHISIQGTLAFALGEETDSLIPNYSFGNISLNNPTFARGLITGDGVKIPIFPDSLKNSMVYCTPSFKQRDLAKLSGKLDKLLKNGKLSDKKYNVIQRVVKEIYNDERVFKLSSYSEQVHVISSELWKQLFRNCKSKNSMPDIVNLEIEPITKKLIELDLSSETSLLFKVLFDKKLRKSLLNKLSGKYGCWDIEKLEQLNYSQSDLEYILSVPEEISKYKENRAKLKGGCGTVFFWGIDMKGRRVPLTLTNDNNTFVLTGVTDSMDKFSIKYDPVSIIEALKNKKILPSLFTVFLEVAFSRGIICYGGFMQVDYLTVMRDKLSKALLDTGYSDWGKIIKNIKTDNLCTGFEFIFNKTEGEHYFSSGIFEILEKNGFNDVSIEKIKKTTVKEANLFGLNFIYNAVYRYNEQKESLKNLDLVSIFSDEMKKMLIL